MLNPAPSGYDSTTWPPGQPLVLGVPCIFPVAKAAAANLAQPFRPDHIAVGESFRLHPPERVRLIRQLDGGKYILCHHASGTLFISRPCHFSPLKDA